MLQKEVRDGMKRRGFAYNKELKGMGRNLSDNKYYKGGYMGVDFKTIDELKLEYPDEEFNEITEGQELI